jgi:hypothetical protein
LIAVLVVAGFAVLVLIGVTFVDVLVLLATDVLLVAGLLLIFAGFFSACAFAITASMKNAATQTMYFFIIKIFVLLI